MTYCRNTDLIWDEDTFDKIWSESDHLSLTPTRWAGSGRGSGWARCARTCTETESRLTQEQKNYLSNLGNGLHHQHPLLSQVWKDLGLKREFEKCLKKLNFTFGMSMSMLWSAQYLKMSESIVTPVLENKISIDTDPFVRNTQTDIISKEKVWPSNASTAVNQHRGVPVLPGGNLDDYSYDQ